MKDSTHQNKRGHFRMHLEKCEGCRNLEAKTSLKVSIIVPFGFVVCDREGTALSR